MRVFVTSIAALIVIAVLRLYVLDTTLQQTADQAFNAATYVRFPHEDAGHNLVGKDWSSAKKALTIHDPLHDQNQVGETLLGL